jgi:hypothetical protein
VTRESRTFSLKGRHSGRIGISAAADILLYVTDSSAQGFRFPLSTLTITWIGSTLVLVLSLLSISDWDPVLISASKRRTRTVSHVQKAKPTHACGRSRF